MAFYADGFTPQEDDTVIFACSMARVWGMKVGAKVPWPVCGRAGAQA